MHRKSGIISQISKVIPLMKNIEFHKLIAKVTGICATGHVIAHFMNFASRPNILNTFGYGPWISGAIISIAMLGIYSAAPDLVRRGNFQIFWINHNLFVVFFGGLLVHALSEAKFLYYCSSPLIFYIIERIFRYKRGSKSVFVTRIKYIKPVLEIRFTVSNFALDIILDGEFLSNLLMIFQNLF